VSGQTDGAQWVAIGYSSWVALAFLALVIVLMAYFPDTQVALLVGPLWLVLLTALFYGFRPNATRTRSSISAEPSFPLQRGGRGPWGVWHHAAQQRWRGREP
jgi:hypothetical protein